MKTRPVRYVALGSLAVLAACQHEPLPSSSAATEEAKQYAATVIDPRRSLVATELPILARFSFQRVLDQLVAQSGVPGLTSLALFQQWWDTQNPPDEAVGTGSDCTGELNTYPYLCRPRSSSQEGVEALNNPFPNPGVNPASYIPIGLFNRFDLAPANGANCGEHRIVYARQSGIADGRNRNLIIFEATLPNPNLSQGLRGCEKIVKFWEKLSSENNINKRADDLEAFYFTGIPGVGGSPPVVHVNHFGNNPTGVGQIRTNQFMQPVPITPIVWNLREFKLLATPGALTVVPVTVKTNPFGPLFAPGGTHAQKPAFDAHFVTQVEDLAADTLARISMNTPDQFNSGQSLASGSTENNYLTQFAGPSTLRDNIQAALTTLGSTLTPDDIVNRARANSCAGCHRFNNGVAIGGGLIWPASLGFVHVAENLTEVSPEGQTRFQISPALINDFLPVRQQVMQDFLDNKPPKVKHPSDPIGGRRVH